MLKFANDGTDAVNAVTSPMAHAASSAARSSVTGAGIGTIAGAILSKGKLHATGVGGVTGAALGAISGVHRSSQQRHMAMQSMGLEPKSASLIEAFQKGCEFALQQVGGMLSNEKQASIVSDSIVNIAQGFDQHVLHNVGHAAAAMTRGAGHVAEGVSDLDLQGKLRSGGKYLQDFGKNGMNRVVWGRTIAGIAGAGLAYGAGREIADAERSRQIYLQGRV